MPLTFRSGFLTPAATATLFLAASAAVWAQNSQSPINITGDPAVSVYNPALPALNFTYGTTSLSVINNGSPGQESTIKANVPAGAGSVVLSGVTYELKQFHFHTESEHQINGADSEMEMHLVHQDSNGNYLVLGRLIEAGALNLALDPIFSNLPPTTSDTLPVFNFNLTGLLPGTSTSHRYSGSLTTSPYTEPVQWVVFSEKMELSQGQINNFRALFTGPDGNEREPQPLNGRTIQTDVAGFVVPEPGGVALGLLGFGILAALRRRQA
ncbi:MAG: carbonic anhydrase family protein [Limisphaerales bacterium]